MNTFAGFARMLRSSATQQFDLTKTRGFRWTWPAAYWRRIAKAFPISGRTRASMDDELSRATSVAVRPAETVLLDGLDIIGTRAFFHGRWLGDVGASVADAWRAARNESASTVQIERLRAEGFLFDCPSKAPAPNRSLVVAPHCDDAALAIGGTLAARRSEERPLIIDPFTVSGYVGIGIATRTIEEVTPMRAREESLSARILGADNLALNLWEIDIRSFHRAAVDGYPVPEDFRFDADPNVRTLGERDTIRYGIRAAMKVLQPSRVYFPLGLGGHADHLYARDLCLELVDEIDAAIYFYEDQPYATYRQVDALEIASNFARTLRPELVDVTKTFERKIQSIAAHRSQFSRAENESRLRTYAEELGNGRTAERLWRLTSA